MSSEYPPLPNTQESLYADMKLSNPSPNSQLANSALAYVASSVNAGLENIEPSLAAMSSHAAIQPAPPADDGVGQFHSNGGAAADVAAMGPTSGTTTNKVDDDFITQDPSAPAAEVLRAKRLNRACDACSKRKVKCDNERPCKNCRDLQIECTFDRPTKRRGPVNRVAEELKRLKRASDDAAGLTQAGAQEGPNEHSYLSHLSFDVIAPFQVIDRLMNVFTTYIYPLYPFPHENLFLDKLHMLPESNDHTFLALVASMAGMVAVTYPRLARVILLDEVVDGDLTPFVDRCVKVAADTRGTLYLTRVDLNVNDAATSFFLGMIGARLNRWGQFRLYMTECLGILQLPWIPSKDGSDPSSFVDLEIATRIKSALFIEMKSLEQLSPDYRSYMMPMSPLNLQHLPAEADDFFIYHDRLEPQSEGRIPFIAGFNIITRLYSCYHEVSQLKNLELSDALLQPIYGEIEQQIISDIDNCKKILSSAPRTYVSPPGPEIQADVLLSPEDRQQFQLDIQKSAIKIAAFSIRVYLTQALKEINLLVKSDDVQEQVESELACIALEFNVFMSKLVVGTVAPHAGSVMMKMDQILEMMLEIRKAESAGAEDAQAVIERIGELKEEFAGLL